MARITVKQLEERVVALEEMNTKLIELITLQTVSIVRQRQRLDLVEMGVRSIGEDIAEHLDQVAPAPVQDSQLIGAAWGPGEDPQIDQLNDFLTRHSKRIADTFEAGAENSAELDAQTWITQPLDNYDLAHVRSRVDLAEQTMRDQGAPVHGSVIAVAREYPDIYYGMVWANGTTSTMPHIITMIYADSEAPIVTPRDIEVVVASLVHRLIDTHAITGNPEMLPTRSDLEKLADPELRILELKNYTSAGMQA